MPTHKRFIFLTMQIKIFLCHIRLIQQAVKQILGTTSLERDSEAKALNSLQEVAERIATIGETLQVKKRDGRRVADGWNHEHFAVTRNESKEVGDRVLFPYQSPKGEVGGIPWELIHAHDVTSDAHEGVIDTTIQYEQFLLGAGSRGEELFPCTQQELPLFLSLISPTPHSLLPSFKSTDIRL